MVVSPGSVDLRTGRFVVDVQDLAIGLDSVGALEFKRVTAGEHPIGTGGPGKMAQFGHNWDIELKQYKSCANCNFVGVVNVSLSGVSYSFNDNGQSLNLTSNTGYAKLVRTMVGSTQNYYTLTTSDGAVAIFQTISYPGPNTTYATAYPLSISKADGAIFTFGYNGSNLVSVTSNTGYRLVLESVGGFVSKACVINLANVIASSTCPSGAQTVSYGYSGSYLTSVTDRTGAVWAFSSNFTAWNVAFSESLYRPGEQTPYVTNHWDMPTGENDVIVSQDFADGRRFDYSYQAETYQRVMRGGEWIDKDFNLGTGWTLNNSLTTQVNLGSNGYIPPVVAPTPLSVTDPLGRTSTWSYPPINQWDGGAVLQARTMPEGNSESYTYDSYRNLTKVDRAPKSNSSLAHVITTSTFGNCGNANLLACNKPTATVDAKGNQTDYSYDPVHGGILTESAPADANGVRPVKRYSYVQRYAWISNGSGGYTAMSSPIWLLAEERICRATATSGNGCAGGTADEVVTSYDYGPNDGPNNLWLRGKVITADGVSLRACYGYDTQGRRISETSPRAGLTSCP